MVRSPETDTLPSSYPGRMKRLAILVVVLLAVFLPDPPAHADDASFLADLQTNHIGTGPINDPVGMGHFICTQIRGGMSPESAGHMTSGWGVDMPGIVGAAQRNLCPDTLPR